MALTVPLGGCLEDYERQFLPRCAEEDVYEGRFLPRYACWSRLWDTRCGYRRSLYSSQARRLRRFHIAALLAYYRQIGDPAGWMVSAQRKVPSPAPARPPGAGVRCAPAGWMRECSLITETDRTDWTYEACTICRWLFRLHAKKRTGSDSYNNLCRPYRPQK